MNLVSCVFASTLILSACSTETSKLIDLNQSGDFKEYVGKTISESDLLDSCGFDLASEIRSAGYEVDEIFKRDNGIINVNYSQTTLEEDNTVWVEYHNATYNEETGQFVDVFESGNLTWQDSDFQGTYVSAITQ